MTPLAFLQDCLGSFTAVLEDADRKADRVVCLAGLDVSGADALPSARMVVVRDWNDAPPSFQFHTDRRSAKVEQMSGAAGSTALFWDKQSKIQLRFLGRATEVPGDSLRSAAWSSLGFRASQSFRRHQAPGEAILEPEALSFDEADGGIPENFLLVNVELHNIDCLSLATDPHYRVVASFSKGVWSAHWIAP